MGNQSQLTTELVIWVFVVVVAVYSQWCRKLPGVGLPLAYLFSLSMIHWFGALIYTLPWYSTPDSRFVELGFIQSIFGVIAFGVGSVIVSPWLIQTFKFSWLQVAPNIPNFKLPEAYMCAGLFLCTALVPILRNVPSFSALAWLGSYLFVVGLCLACWKAWYRKKTGVLIGWLGIVVILPLITTITLGFIGYGATASLVVLLFIFKFYRPRWQAAIAALLVLILGFSVFITYLRDRNEIRATVWGEKDVSTRVEQLWNTANNFETLNLYNKDHLSLIDIRLNQNILVGRAVYSLSSNRVEYAAGETLWQAVVAVIPRFLWSDKPVFAGSPKLVSKYTGIYFARGVSVGVGQVLEFYINFGSTGVILGFLILGVIIKLVDVAAGQRLIQGDWQGCISWFLPGLGLLQPGGSLVEVVSTTAAAVVLGFLMNKFYIPLVFQRQHYT